MKRAQIEAARVRVKELKEEEERKKLESQALYSFR